jgi:hypothetical protein
MHFRIQVWDSMGVKDKRSQGLRLALIFVAVGSMCASVQAQNYDNPGLGELPVISHPQDSKPLGIRAGGFMLHPGVQLAAEYNDNVFYTAENTQSDTAWHFRPYITAQSGWSRHSLNIRLAADVSRYQDYSFQDYEDYFLLINGRVDVRNRSFFSYTADYMNLHEGRNNRSAEQGITPTRYDLYGGSLGYDHTFNRLSIGVLGTWRRMDFDDTFSLEDGNIDNQDRDRDESSFSVRAGYQFQTDKQAFVSVVSNRVNYKEKYDRNGLDRTSDGYTVNGGLRFNITGLLSGDVFASYHDQSYDDPTLPDVTGWAGGAGLQWTPSRLTMVGASITSGVEATTYQYSSGYLRTLYSVRADHELMRNLQISGQVSYSVNDYQLTLDAPEGARSKDKIWMAGVGMTYFFNRWLFLSASYDYEKLTSNQDQDRYDANRFWLVLSLER